MNYTIFEYPTGKILRTVTTTDIEAQLNVNESYIEGNYNDSLYYIQNGTPIEIPTKPNQYSVFDWFTYSWKIDLNIAKYLIIQKRNQLLTYSDWTQLPDVSLATKESWAAYRQALRDITLQPEYPLNVVWPTPPQ